MSKSKSRVAPRLDAANLAGITELMNPQHLKSGVDLEAAERAVMGRAGVGSKKAESDPVRLYTEELNQLAEELGLDLLDEGADLAKKPPKKSHQDSPRDATPSSRPLAAASTTKKPPSMSAGNLIAELGLDLGLDLGGDPGKKKKKPARSESRSPSKSSSTRSSRSKSRGSVSGTSGSYESGSYESGSYESGSYESSCDCASSCSSSCDCGCHESGSYETESGDDSKVNEYIDQLQEELGIGKEDKRDRHRHRLKEMKVPHTAGHRRSEPLTEEQERRRHISDVVADIRGETRTTHGVERERARDVKITKLERIGQLLMVLQEEGIETKGIAIPTIDSPMETIDGVLDVLSLKNNCNRYSSIAEELILGCAEGVENVFDGTRSLPLVGWKPDYTGYHNTVNAKLHRMRFETSQVVGSVIQRFNIGPTARILMELLPSFFLYPRQQKRQRGSPGLASDPHVSDARWAYSAIRDSDTKKDLDSLRNV